MSAKDRLSLKQ